MAHERVSFPHLYDNEIIASANRETLISIESIYNSADPRIEQLPINYRGCTFPNEQKLKYFQIYS